VLMVNNTKTKSESNMVSLEVTKKQPTIE